VHYGTNNNKKSENSVEGSEGEEDPIWMQSENNNNNKNNKKNNNNQSAGMIFAPSPLSELPQSKRNLIFILMAVGLVFFVTIGLLIFFLVPRTPALDYTDIKNSSISFDPFRLQFTELYFIHNDNFVELEVTYTHLAAYYNSTNLGLWEGKTRKVDMRSTEEMPLPITITDISSRTEDSLRQTCETFGTFQLVFDGWMSTEYLFYSHMFRTSFTYRFYCINYLKNKKKK